MAVKTYLLSTEEYLEESPPSDAPHYKYNKIKIMPTQVKNYYYIFIV